MLVLSRRLNEKVVLPDVATSIQVISLTPHSVALGIDAPQEVRVLREEVPDRRPEWAATTDSVSPLLLIELNQLVQKRMDLARRGMAVMREQLEAGDGEGAARTLAAVEDELGMLQRRVQQEVTGAIRPPLPAGEPAAAERPEPRRPEPRRTEERRPEPAAGFGRRGR
jgi:carbon storage regulator CsrA